MLITAHDAFNYFGRAYGFEVRGLQGISTASEAGTGDVRGLADFIAERRIPALFIESSVPVRNIEAVQAAVRARGFEVVIGGELFSDAMGSAGTPEGTYIGMVRHNIDTIVAGAVGRVSHLERTVSDNLEAASRQGAAIEVTDLTVAYHEQPVLWDVDLDVPQGVLMAIVGPNGAGKTTLIKAILGLVQPAAGQVRIYGKPYAEQRSLVGYVPQRGSVDWDFPTNVLDVVTMGLYGQLGWIKRPGKAEHSWRWRGWTRSAWPTSPTARSASFRAASSSASSWPAPWCRTRRSTSWTSRLPGWMPSPSGPSSPCCASCGRRARRSSSSITTCRRCRSTSTGSRC